MIDIDQPVQELFDWGHAEADDGMKRLHPLLLSLTQLKAQIPHALQRLAPIETQRSINAAATGRESVKDRVCQSQTSEDGWGRRLLLGLFFHGPRLTWLQQELALSLCEARLWCQVWPRRM